MSGGLKGPISADLVWAKVLRPRIPLVYLDLNTIIYIARALGGQTNVPTGYVELYELAVRAKGRSGRCFRWASRTYGRFRRSPIRSNVATWPTSSRPLRLSVPAGSHFHCAIGIRGGDCKGGG